MDLDTQIDKTENANRDTLDTSNLALLCGIFLVALIGLLILLDPILAIACSGFIAFFLQFFYWRVIFKRLLIRITLLQTKIEKSHKK